VYLCLPPAVYREPVKFPKDGMYLGVAERYEIVCDFSKFKAKTLYLWNDKDDKRMINVPYFCYSHLLARLDIGGRASGATHCCSMDTCTTLASPGMLRLYTTTPRVDICHLSLPGVALLVYFFYCDA
jgi:hypothetical protein